MLIAKTLLVFNLVWLNDLADETSNICGNEKFNEKQLMCSLLNVKKLNARE